MARLWRALFSASAFFYPLVMHFLIVRDMIFAALVGLVIVNAAAALLQLLNRQHRGHALPYLLLAVTGLVGIGMDGTFALYLPPVVLNLMLALVFGRTLGRGQMPLIERFMRLHHRDGTADLRRLLGRQLTVAWTIFFVGCAVTGLVLALFASLAAWSLFANFINYLLIVAMFLGQFVYAFLRYRALRLIEIVPMALRVMRSARSTTLGH